MKLKFVAKTFVLTLMAAQTLNAKDLATFAGEKITEKEFLQEVEKLGERGAILKTQPDARLEFMDRLITFRLLEKEGKKKGLDKSKEFAEQMDAIKTQLIAKLYVDDYVKEQNTEKNQKKYFDTNKDKYSSLEICARHILIKDDEKKAKSLLEEAKKKGVDFAELSKKNSDGPSKDRGGDLGCFGKGRMVPEFETAAFATKKGEIYNGVVKTQFGYHVIKVEDIKGSEKVSFDEVKDKVEGDYAMELKQNVVEELKKSANIKVEENVLKELKI